MGHDFVKARADNAPLAYLLSVRGLSPWSQVDAKANV